MEKEIIMSTPHKLINIFEKLTERKLEFGEYFILANLIDAYKNKSTVTVNYETKQMLICD